MHCTVCSATTLRDRSTTNVNSVYTPACTHLCGSLHPAFGRFGAVHRAVFGRFWPFVRLFSAVYVPFRRPIFGPFFPFLTVIGRFCVCAYVLTPACLRLPVVVCSFLAVFCLFSAVVGRFQAVLGPFFVFLFVVCGGFWLM